MVTFTFTMTRRICITLFCLFFSYQLDAQLFPKRHLRVQDGLVQKQVTCLFEDSQGAMWIGTRGGLNRFDGHNLDSWTVQNGLESNLIRAITEDSSGRVLVFTNTGVNRIQKRKASVLCSRKFYHLNSARNDGSGFSYFLTNTGILDLWICDPAGRIERYPFLETFQANPQEIWKNPDNSDVLLKDTKASYYLLKGGMITPITNFSSMPWLNYPMVSNEKILDQYPILFTNSTASGFLPFEDREIRTVYHPAAGWFWYSVKRPNTLLLRNSNGNEEIKYPFASINVLVIDRSAQVWVGTDNGVLVFHHLFFRDYINPDVMREPSAIVEGDQGEIVVANSRSGLAVIGDQGFRPARFSIRPEEKDLKVNMTPDEFYGGAAGFHGQAFLNTSKGVLTLEGGDLKRSVPLPAVAVYSSLKDDRNHRILFSSFQNGIFSFSEEGVLKQEVVCSHPALDRIYSMELDDSGSLYFGSEYTVATAYAGGYRLFTDIHGDTVPGAYTINRDNRGSLWFGNDYGLYVYQGHEIEKISHEFLDQTIRAAKIINGNQLLVGTSEGIGVLFLDDFYANHSIRLKWYDFRNGFEGGEVCINGFYMDRRGFIWIAGSGGLVRMDPKWIRMDKIPIRAEVREIQTGSDKQGWKLVDADSTGLLRLDHKQDQIRISYSGIDLKSPDRDFYQYRLVGHSSQWNAPNQELFAMFNNLSPGKYRFEVRVRNKDDVWSQAPATVAIEIIPAWYQTLLVKIVLLILGMSLIIWATNSITRSIHRVKMQKVKKDHELAELNLAVIRSQLEPHFVFNVLNSIGYAIRANETDMAYDHLTKFSSLMRKWLKSAEESMLTLESELNLVREYLDLEKFRFEDRLNYSIEMAEGVPTYIKVPRMILQIPVENAVKHGISNLPSGGNLIIRIDHVVNGIKILVQDNGIGREAAAKRSAAGNQKGIQLMEKMLGHIREFHHYDVSYQVVDLANEEGVPEGTSVEIVLKFS
jgi:ligand-binding sensor domain-containing protein